MANLTGRRNINAKSNAKCVTGNTRADGSTNAIQFGALLEWDDATDCAIRFADTAGHAFAGIAAEYCDTDETQIKIFSEVEISGLAVAGTPEPGVVVYCGTDNIADITTVDPGNTQVIGYISAYDGSTYTVVFHIA